MARETTTIEISRDRWRELNALKEPGDSFDDVLGRLLEADVDQEAAPTGPGADRGGTLVECHHCGHSWKYTGDMVKATCPGCSNKTPVE